MKIYLASAYSRREEMRGIAARLIAAGHDITARWIQGNHETPPFGIEVDSRAHCAWCAEDDVADVIACDVLVSVTGQGHRSRGGRHVEFGIALGLGKRLIVLGDFEHVFHSLWHVERCDSVDDLIALLAFRAAAAA